MGYVSTENTVKYGNSNKPNGSSVSRSILVFTECAHRRLTLFRAAMVGALKVRTLPKIREKVFSPEYYGSSKEEEASSSCSRRVADSARRLRASASKGGDEVMEFAKKGPVHEYFRFKFRSLTYDRGVTVDPFTIRR